jgi:hypothetical protein
MRRFSLFKRGRVWCTQIFNPQRGHTCLASRQERVVAEQPNTSLTIGCVGSVALHGRH